MKLYPIKFEAILKSTIWGGNEICNFKNISPVQDSIGESWEISQIPDNVSIVANGELTGKSLTDLINLYGKELMGKHVVDRFGTTFPLLIKFIDACNDLSIQVHPDDELAEARHHSLGKTEMWYVISSREGAGLYSGFSQQITPEEYVTRVETNHFMEVLKRYEVKEGDVFYLPAGRVHAIGSGNFIAEIQQNSDVTYRIYDYNRKDVNGNSRELHTYLAKDAIDYTVLEDYKTHYTKMMNAEVDLVDCKYFHTNLLDIDQPMTRDIASLDSFVVYMCMNGELTLEDFNGFTMQVNKGDTILVPACIENIKLLPDGEVKLLEAYIPKPED